MQHYSSPFQILREEKKTHPPRGSPCFAPCPHRDRPTCVGATVLQTCGLLSLSPHRGSFTELFCLHGCQWYVQRGHLPGFLPLAPVPPGKQKSGILSWDLSWQSRFCRVSHITCFSSSSYPSDPLVFVRTLDSGHVQPSFPSLTH